MENKPKSQLNEDSKGINKLKTLTFKYQPNAKNHTREALKKAINGEPQIFDDIIFFNSLNIIDTFINPAKAKIINSVLKNQPHSIDELFQLLQIEENIFQKELISLVLNGVIFLEENLINGNKVKVPKVIYDRIVLDYDFAKESAS